MRRFVGIDDRENENQEVIAVDATTGSLRWKHRNVIGFGNSPVEDDTTTSPAVLDGVVYMASLGDDVYALEEQTEPAERFDENNDGSISLTELTNAATAFARG